MEPKDFEALKNKMSEERKKIKDEINNSLKNLIKTFVLTALIIAGESLIIHFSLSYIFEEYNLSYIKTALLLLILRLAFRNTRFGAEKKSEKQ